MIQYARLNNNEANISYQTVDVQANRICFNMRFWYMLK